MKMPRIRQYLFQLPENLEQIYWSSRIAGAYAGLKIQRKWFDSTGLHRSRARAVQGPGLQNLGFVGSNPTVTSDYSTGQEVRQAFGE